MATKPSWLSLTPTSGSGNGTISNSAGEHTGRVARTGTVTVTGVGVTIPATYKVTQTPKAEFVTFDDGAEMSAPKDASTLTIEGLSNSSKLTFAWVGGDGNGVSIPVTYQANGMMTNNGDAIEGDPGATSQYAFNIELEIPKNDTIEEVTRILRVTSNGGKAVQISIVQTAGDARLSVSPTEITIPQDGSAVSVQVTSNTSWMVS